MGGKTCEMQKHDRWEKEVTRVATKERGEKLDGRGNRGKRK